MTGLISDNRLMKDLRYHYKSLDFIKGQSEPWEAFTASTGDDRSCLNFRKVTVVRMRTVA